MSDPFGLTDEQMVRLHPYFPKSHGRPRVDDRRVLSGIIFINRNDLPWRDAPREYGPPKTLYNRWNSGAIWASSLGSWRGWPLKRAAPSTVMIDATDLKAHRTAIGLRAKKGGVDG